MEQKQSQIQKPTASGTIFSAHRQGDPGEHKKSSSLFKTAWLVLKVWVWEIHWIICSFTKAYEQFTAFIVLLNISILVADTFESISLNAGWFFSALDSIFLGIYLMEFLLKFIVSGHLYFKSFWNDLDFILLLISLVELWVEIEEYTGNVRGSQNTVFNMLRIFKGLRAAKALRAHRIIRHLKSYQVILSTCRQSLRSMGSIIILMFLVQLMFSVIIRETYSETDPERFRNIFRTFFTLFQLLTLDDWFLIYTASRDRGAPGIIIYLIPYIVLMNFILLNLVVSVLVDNFQTAIKKRTTERMAAKRKSLDEIEEFHDVDEDAK